MIANTIITAMASYMHDQINFTIMKGGDINFKQFSIDINL